MADGLDVVAVRIEHEGAVVAGVVMFAHAGRAIVATACRDGRRVEGVDSARLWVANATCRRPVSGVPPLIQK
jgi:hypothetical protein